MRVAGPEDGTTRLSGGSARAIVAATIVGLLVTAAASWAALSLDRHNEQRLLGVQTRQAAALITAEVGNIASPLDTALHIAAATDGSSDQFVTYMSPHIGAGKLFADASLWRTDGTAPRLVASAGTPVAPLYPTATDDLLRQAERESSFAVAGLPAGSMNRVAYAMADATAPGYVVFAERAIPANRRVPVESDAAFSNLHFATYLGDSTRSTDVATTDVAPSDLPLRGLTDRTEIPFGNTVITLVASRRNRLGGSLGAELPWIFVAFGLLMTATTALGLAQLVRRRRTAEQDALTITQLYERLDHRFGEQRHISETLQRALLPQRNPAIAGLEVASRYVAGTRGIEVGGDWFSIVPVDDEHFGFVVGDVSGRGLSAATIMARLRFTVRAYLLEGHQPDRALQMCCRQLDLVEDQHFATVLVGVGNLATRTVTVANAGHLNPLLLTDADREYVPTTVGLPLGVVPSFDYELTTFTMPPRSTLVVFTDGLVERRGEDLMRGLERLADAAATRDDSLDESLARILTTMNDDGGEDDIAILAFRWLDLDAPAAHGPVDTCAAAGEALTRSDRRRSE